MKRVKILVLWFLLALGWIDFGSAAEMRPFTLDWRDNPLTPVNLSSLSEKPAGRDGFIRIENGHFIQPNGRRLRIWGINVSAMACFPNKKDAATIASYLSRMGINGVRFHFMDSPWTKFLNAEPGTSRRLDVGLLDRLDYFIAKLIEQGIYINLNLNVARQFTKGDGVEDAEYLGYAKAVTYFAPRLIELQKEYSKQLLAHVNPYTERAYTEEPAVLIVELVNENSLVESWMAGRLLGKNEKKFPGTWSDIPASYERKLTQRFNTWLPTMYSAEELGMLRKESGVASNQLIPRLRPDQFTQASTFRFHTEAMFYMETEKAYFHTMANYLKQELGLKAYLVGSSDHNHYKTGYPHLSSTSLLDVVDGHVYWQHPNLGERVNGRQTFSIANTPMVNDPLFSTVVQLARSAVVGKPYTVSEINHPYPHEYACEGIPILAAYGALQDWDGIFFYTLEHQTPEQWLDVTRGHFDFRPDVMKMVNLAASSLLFRRGDVQPARRTILRSYSRREVIQGIQLPSQELPFFTPGFSLAIPLVHQTRITAFDRYPQVYEQRDTPKAIVSDTTELVWSVENPAQGLVSVNTPRAQALIGFVKQNPRSLDTLSASIETEFCSILGVALDEKPLDQSSKILLTATAKAINSNAKWNENRTTLEQWGEAPMQYEIVTGTLHFNNRDQEKPVWITPLDGAGRALGPRTQGEYQNGQWHLPIGNYPTLWYLIEQ
ncbi:MAG: hypothetical protein RBU29_03620 [bacterium]|jgi:hypothetical protein|nr:hypothetical protein [bacterium]